MVSIAVRDKSLFIPTDTDFFASWSMGQCITLSLCLRLATAPRLFKRVMAPVSVTSLVVRMLRHLGNCILLVSSRSRTFQG